MVWVTNQSSVTITVQITNTSGGSASTFTIYPKQNETWELNHWQRKGPEVATIKLTSGKGHEIEVLPDAYVKVFDDAILKDSAFFAVQLK
jgi:hypothetical protein